MYNLNAGRLRNKVVFMEYVDSADEYYRNVQKLQEFKTVWAEVKPVRGTNYLDQYKEKNKLLIKVTCRYFPECNEDMVVIINDEPFEITAVIDVENTHHVLEVMCSKRIQEDKPIE